MLFIFLHSIKKKLNESWFINRIEFAANFQHAYAHTSHAKTIFGLKIHNQIKLHLLN